MFNQRMTPDNDRTTDSPPIVFVQGLYKAFGQVRAVDGIDLTIKPATITALLGPNGSGKTTFVRILCTLLRPDRGTAKIAGLDVVRDAAAVRSIIGLAGQNTAVDDILSGRENLEMMGRLYHLDGKEARRRAGDLLDFFGLADAAGRRVKTYSGGMRRRLDLAASMIAYPPMIFLDEPTSGLDPRSRVGLWEVINGLVQRGTTIFLTTQYLEEADRVADTVAVLDAGRIIRQGTPLELKDCCGGDTLLYVEMADPAGMEAATRVLTELSNDKLQVDAAGSRVNLPAREGTATLVDVVRRLDSAGIAIADLGLRKPTLDDVFLQLTGRKAEVETPGKVDDGPEEGAPTGRS